MAHAADGHPDWVSEHHVYLALAVSFFVLCVAAIGAISVEFATQRALKRAFTLHEAVEMTQMRAMEERQREQWQRLLHEIEQSQRVAVQAASNMEHARGSLKEIRDQIDEGRRHRSDLEHRVAGLEVHLGLRAVTED